MRSLIKKFLSIQIFMVLVISQIGSCAGTDDDTFDRMERGEIKHCLSNPDTSSSPGLSWSQMAALPVHFVTSLFQPLTDLASATMSSFRTRLSSAKHMSLIACLERGEGVEDFQYGAAQKAQDVVLQLAGDVKDTVSTIGGAIKDNPLDSASLGVAFAVSWTGIGEMVPAATAAVAGVINGVRNSKTLYSMAQSFDGDNIGKKALKVVVYGGMAYVIVTAIASIPGASAIEWNSLADARKHYDTTRFCTEKPWPEVIQPAYKCLLNGGSLETCQKLIPSPDQFGETGRDLVSFTRSATLNPNLDPVIRVEYGANGKICVDTALKSTDPVTRICFPDLKNNPQEQVVEALKGYSLQDMQKGLLPGQTVRHIGMHLTKGSCGGFSEISAAQTLPGNSVCVLSALNKGGPVTQLCLDPQNPDHHTIRENTDYEIHFDDQGKPVSLLFRNPRKVGIDPDALVRTDSVSKPLIKQDHITEGQRVCEGDKCYEYQKVEVPCERDEL